MTGVDAFGQHNRSLKRCQHLQFKVRNRAGSEIRIIPWFPELRAYLDECFDQGPGGTKLVVTPYRSPSVNLRTRLSKMVQRGVRNRDRHHSAVCGHAPRPSSTMTNHRTWHRRGSATGHTSPGKMTRRSPTIISKWPHLRPAQPAAHLARTGNAERKSSRHGTEGNKESPGFANSGDSDVLNAQGRW